MEPSNDTAFKTENSAAPVIRGNPPHLNTGAALIIVDFRYYRTQGQGSQVGIGFPFLFVGLAAKSESAMKAKMANFCIMFFVLFLLNGSNVGTTLYGTGRV